MRKPAPVAKARAVPLPGARHAMLLVLVLLGLYTPVRAAEAPAAPDWPVPDLSALDLQSKVARADEAIAENRYDDAIALLNEAWQQAGDPRESPIARNVLNTLANLHYNTGQLELAERYFQELVELDTQSHDLPALAVSLFNLGHVAASSQRFDEASDYFTRALELSMLNGDRSGAAYTQKALGVNAQAQGQLVAASAWLNKALDTFNALGDVEQSAIVHRNLGDLAQDQGNPAAAIEHYMAALPVLAASGQVTPLLRTWRGLSVVLEELEEWEKSLYAQRAYTELLQSSLEQQGADTTQRLQFELDTQRYADANARLQTLSEIQQQKLTQSLMVQRLQYLVLLMGGALLLLVLVMYRRSRRMAEQMHAQATTDHLTCLPNRRAIMEHGEREWHRTRRSGESLVCMVLDVDHFKSINDTFGHAAGDAVLRKLAEILRNISRQADLIGRVGGEEFLVLAAGADARQSLSLAERIRIRVELAEIDAIGKRPLTLSIGIACHTREATLEELIQHADKALYQAKQTGRNRVVIFQPEKVRPQLTVLEGGALRV